MLQDQPLSGPSLEDIERALDEAVSALVAYRQTPPEGVARALAAKKRKGIVAYGGAALAGTDFDVLRATDLASSPVEAGLKNSIRELGKLTYALVGDLGMHEVAKRILALDSKNEAQRASPIDSAWNGIGHWVS